MSKKADFKWKFFYFVTETPVLIIVDLVMYTYTHICIPYKYVL